MLKGKDGRFYDPIFDLNRDGKLDAAEFIMMEEIIYGSDKSDDEDDDELDEDYDDEDEDYEDEDDDLEDDDEDYDDEEEFEDYEDEDGEW